ncbi:MAG: alpha/beta fold hydrolase [Candidatus Lindowbacteria bacterium]|nr:alpha/beta fold hydrolase [Candidatus Lindowbacteria bacterium]
MTQLRKVWAQARTGARQTVLLAGEPRIGKTLLAAEFAFAVHEEGAIVLFDSAESGATSPHLPFVDAVRHYLSVYPADTPPQHMENLGPDAMFALLTDIARTRPLVLFLDDLHRADEQTIALLKRLSRAADKASLLILGAYRNTEISRTAPLSEMIADLQSARALTHILLHGFDEVDAEVLLAAQIGHEPARALVKPVREYTEGNPFFIQDVLQTIAEKGIVLQGALITDSIIEKVGVPPAAKEVIDKRLSRLTKSCYDVLAAASVIGREFDIETLERTTRLPRERLVELMEEALAAQVISESPRVVARYIFPLDLIRAALFATLSITRRAHTHAQSLRYADNNGVKLAYEVLGASGPYMIPLGIGNSAAVRPLNRPLARRWDRFASFCRLVLYDRRGLGFSDAPERGYSLLASVEDVRAVLDAVGAGTAVLWGATDGGPLAIAFAARHPERVAGLILAGATPRIYNSDDFQLGINPAAMEDFLRAENPNRARAVSQLMTRHDAEAAQGNIEVLKLVPQHAWSKMVGGLGVADARPFLENVSVPTLIIHDQANDYIPVEAAQYMNKHIRGSMLVITDEYTSEHFGESLYSKIQTFVEDVTVGSGDSEEAGQHHFLRARAALLRGDIGEAAVHVDLALKSSLEGENSFRTAMCYLARAHVLHGLGKPEEAEDQLLKAFGIARQIESPEAEFNAFWSEAQFAAEKGDDAAGLASLQKALAIARERGYLTTFVDRPAVTASLCVKALEADIEVEHVTEIIKRRGLVPENPPIHLENWPWPLKIYTLGRFWLIKDDEPIKVSRKAQQKPLSLLKALIGLGALDRGTSDNQIADSLWPDAEGDIAHQSLATTLHRLRRLLGRQDAVQLREGRLTMDSESCWVDVWAFENLLAQAETAWRKQKREKSAAVRLTEAALSIYRGPFLADEPEEPWMFSPRERLKSRFLQAVAKLARYWEEAEMWEKAAECYRRGLEVDDLTEEFYRGLMVCHRQIGARADALMVYDRCRKILLANLKVGPSPETEAIRKSILSEKKS